MEQNDPVYEFTYNATSLLIRGLCGLVIVGGFVWLMILLVRSHYRRKRWQPPYPPQSPYPPQYPHAPQYPYPPQAQYPQQPPHPPTEH